MTQDISPRAFISYAWSSPEHQAWVIKLAEELVHSGVDVDLDRWGLREGHDKFEFMEKMVNDPEMRKVIIVCDRVYKEKANSREGGVGTETRILTPQLYGGQNKDKFCAVLAERGDGGEAYLPAYYESRLYIDLSDDELYATNFEQLVRWIFDKPVHRKPPLGPVPAYLLQESTKTLGSSVAFRRAFDSIKSHKPNSSGATQEYFDIVVQHLDRFRVQVGGESEPFDDLIMGSIIELRSARDEILSLLGAIAQYSPIDESISIVHRFFEGIIRYFFRPNVNGVYRDSGQDNFKFFGRELFLYWVGILIKNDRLEQLSNFLSKQYYVERNPEVGRSQIVGYSVFNDHMPIFEERKQRLRLRQISLEADLLSERNEGSGLDFRSVIQADFLLHFRIELSSQRDVTRWYPDTLIYRRDRGVLEIFARSVSKAYFDRAKLTIGISKKEEMQDLLQSYAKGHRDSFRIDHRKFDPTLLIGYDEIATLP